MECAWDAHRNRRSTALFSYTAFITFVWFWLKLDYVHTFCWNYPVSNVKKICISDFRLFHVYWQRNWRSGVFNCPKSRHQCSKRGFVNGITLAQNYEDCKLLTQTLFRMLASDSKVRGIKRNKINRSPKTPVCTSLPFSMIFDYCSASKVTIFWVRYRRFLCICYSLSTGFCETFASFYLTTCHHVTAENTFLFLSSSRTQYDTGLFNYPPSSGIH